MFGILVHLLMKLTDIKRIADDLVITCDKTIDTVAKLYNDTSETVSINSNHKKQHVK